MSLFSSVSISFLCFLFLCRSDTAATNGSQQCSALVNMTKNVGGQKKNFVLLQIVRKGADVFEIYVSNIRFHNFF